HGYRVRRIEDDVGNRLREAHDHLAALVENDEIARAVGLWIAATGQSRKDDVVAVRAAHDTDHLRPSSPWMLRPWACAVFSIPKAVSAAMSGVQQCIVAGSFSGEPFRDTRMPTIPPSSGPTAKSMSLPSAATVLCAPLACASSSTKSFRLI